MSFSLLLSLFSFLPSPFSLLLSLSLMIIRSALLFYRNDESVSLHGIVSENDSSCLDKFRTTCKVAIINLIRQTRSVRRSLGLSDEPKLPKLPELKLEGRENGIAVVEQLMTVVAGSFEGKLFI